MTADDIGYEAATPQVEQVDADPVETLKHDLEQYQFATGLQAETIRLLTEKNKSLADLLRETEGMLKHTRCIEEDAMRCPACSLEARIEIALKPA